MADKELRRMSRMELIEIIYAVQQEEQLLRRENEDLKSQLEDRRIRIDKAGSIAEASLDLNHIFEDAQAAADQYLASVQEDVYTQADEAEASEETIAQAQEEAQRILTEAQEQAEQIRQQGKQDVEKEREAFLRGVKRMLQQNPELDAAMKARVKREDKG